MIAHLHILIFDILTRRDAIGDIEMYELGRELHGCGEAIDNFHGVEGHVHTHQSREIVGSLIAGHHLEQELDGNHRTRLH